MTILVTGGAGFIGANFVLQRLAHFDEQVVNVDKLTYAGNRENLISVSDNPQYQFIQGDIGDTILIDKLLQQYQPRAIINFAAESHVDRSIHGPEDFIQTNILGTFHLLESSKAYWQSLTSDDQQAFRFLHVSTDEVYGTLSKTDPAFAESNQYQPNSPYSASKASSDHLVRAYHHTYGLPVLTTNCSNNYGPFQFPEKLIPLVIHNALNGKPLPIYGDGQQIRDWLYVGDHCTAITRVLEAGKPGEVYNIGGLNEKTNLEIVHTICDLLEGMAPENPFSRTSNLSLRAEQSIPVYSRVGDNPEGFIGLITYVKDRPGHDRRYAINADKINNELGWQPAETFETGIRKTVQWYLQNQDWVANVVSGEYRNWLDKQYA